MKYTCIEKGTGREEYVEVFDPEDAAEKMAELIDYEDGSDEWTIEVIDEEGTKRTFEVYSEISYSFVVKPK